MGRGPVWTRLTGRPQSKRALFAVVARPNGERKKSEGEGEGLLGCGWLFDLSADELLRFAVRSARLPTLLPVEVEARFNRAETRKRTNTNDISQEVQGHEAPAVRVDGMGWGLWMRPGMCTNWHGMGTGWVAEHCESKKETR